MTLPIPTEEVEQSILVRWLELMRLKFSAIPHSTYTTSIKVKARNRRTGVRAGVPDLLVLIPPERSVDGQGRALFIELKRIKGGVVSPEQEAWIAALNDLNSPAVLAGVCRGSEEAIQLIESLMEKK